MLIDARAVTPWVPMADPYKRDKRKRELERKRKREAKQARKRERKVGEGGEAAPEGGPTEEGRDEEEQSGEGGAAPSSPDASTEREPDRVSAAPTEPPADDTAT